MFEVGEHAKLLPRDRIRLVSRGFLSNAPSFCRHSVATICHSPWLKLGDSQFNATSLHRRSYSGSLNVPSCEEVRACPALPVCIVGISRRARWSKWMAGHPEGRSPPVTLDHGCCFTWEPSSHNRQQRLAKEPARVYRGSAPMDTALIGINARTPYIPLMFRTSAFDYPRISFGAK